jgi:hypothetical protein
MITKETSKDITVNGTKVTCYSDGSVESHDNHSRGRSFGSDDGQGYRKIMVKYRGSYVHELIATAFIGNRPKNYDVDHINGDKSDNRPSNLRYVTRSQNLRGHQKVRGKSKYRGVSIDTLNPKFIVRVGLGKENNYKNKYLGSFTDEKDAAIARDTFCFEELGYPLEGLNFPELFVDKQKDSVQVTSMQNTEENIERVQTQIDMIRQESRLLSYRIDRMTEQRKGLQEEKRKLKDFLTQARKP